MPASCLQCPPPPPPPHRGNVSQPDTANCAKKAHRQPWEARARTGLWRVWGTGTACAAAPMCPRTARSVVPALAWLLHLHSPVAGAGTVTQECLPGLVAGAGDANSCCGWSSMPQGCLVWSGPGPATCSRPPGGRLHDAEAMHCWARVACELLAGEAPQLHAATRAAIAGVVLCLTRGRLIKVLRQARRPSACLAGAHAAHGGCR